MQSERFLAGFRLTIAIGGEKNILYRGFFFCCCFKVSFFVGRLVISNSGLALTCYFFFFKDRHNLHHVATNEVGIDPDIDLAPAFTYMNKHASLNFVQKYQHIYFLPVVSLLHFMWMVSSFRHVFSRGMWARVALLVSNYAFMFWIVYRDTSGVFLWKHLLVASVFKVFLLLYFLVSRSQAI